MHCDAAGCNNLAGAPSQALSALQSHPAQLHWLMYNIKAQINIILHIKSSYSLNNNLTHHHHVTLSFLVFLSP